MVCEASENDERKSVGVKFMEALCKILLCFLTLDFVTVKCVPVVYVASRHFIILYIFVHQSSFLFRSKEII